MHRMTSRAGYRRLLEGVLRHHTGVPVPTSAVKVLRRVPKHVILNCSDPRVAPSRYAQLEPDVMFHIKNAGNFLPHSSTVRYGVAATEPAVLELAFTKFRTVRDVSVCGHSDCKAMKFLHGLKDPIMNSSSIGKHRQELPKSLLKNWILTHGRRSLAEFSLLDARKFSVPLKFSGENPSLQLEAWIDPEQEYDDVDRLAMVNALLQTENVNSYAFMRPGLDNAKYLLHTLWYDVNSEEVLVFSRREKRFIKISQGSAIDQLMSEAAETAMQLRKLADKSSGAQEVEPEQVVANTAAALNNSIKAVKAGALSCHSDTRASADLQLTAYSGSI